jgi:hypothetical protein
MGHRLNGECTFCERIAGGGQAYGDCFGLRGHFRVGNVKICSKVDGGGEALKDFGGHVANTARQRARRCWRDNPSTAQGEEVALIASCLCAHTSSLDACMKLSHIRVELTTHQ